MFSDQKLWQAYKTTHFKWDSDPLGCNRFCIITAYNPRSVVMSKTQNDTNQHKLFSTLRQQALDFVQISAGDQTLDYVEPSVAVICDKNQGVKLARQFDQNAIFMVKNGTLWLIPALIQGREQESLGPFSQRLIGRQ